MNDQINKVARSHSKGQYSVHWCKKNKGNALVFIWSQLKNYISLLSSEVALVSVDINEIRKTSDIEKKNQ